MFVRDARAAVLFLVMAAACSPTEYTKRASKPLSSSEVVDFGGAKPGPILITVCGPGGGAVDAGPVVDAVMASRGDIAATFGFAEPGELAEQPAPEGGTCTGDRQLLARRMFGAGGPDAVPWRIDVELSGDRAVVETLLGKDPETAIATRHQGSGANPVDAVKAALARMKDRKTRGIANPS